MKLDRSDSSELEALLKQSTTVIRAPLNDMGYADVLYSTWTGGLEQVELKMVDEILSNMPHVETQLRKHITNHPDITLWLVITKHCEPHPTGKGTYAYQVQKLKGRVPPLNHYLPGFHYKGIPYTRYEGLLTGLARAGVRIRESPNVLTTAKILVQLEQSAMSEGTTLNRHVKPVIRHHDDPQVMTLLGAHNSGVDVVRAEALIAVFGTVAAIINTSAESIAHNVSGMGLISAKKLLASYGVKDEV